MFSQVLFKVPWKIGVSSLTGKQPCCTNQEFQLLEAKNKLLQWLPMNWHISGLVNHESCNKSQAFGKLFFFIRQLGHSFMVKFSPFCLKWRIFLILVYQRWTDLWLNEGFASYVEYLGVEAVHPEFKVMEQFVTSDVQVRPNLIHQSISQMVFIMKTILQFSIFDWNFKLQ